MRQLIALKHQLKEISADSFAFHLNVVPGNRGREREGTRLMKTPADLKPGPYTLCSS